MTTRVMRMAWILAAAAGVVACNDRAEIRPGNLPGDDLPVPAIDWDPERYVAYRTPAPLQIDGRLDEPAWEAAAWTADFVDIEGPLGSVPRFRTRAKLLWDDASLYIGAFLEEPQVWATLVERDAVIYRDNDFEVFIDPDGDTHHYYELEINALGTLWDLFLVKPYRDGGPAINGWYIRNLEAAVRVDGTLNQPSDIDRGWTVEIALPWPALAEAAHRPSPPEPGDQWRMNFSRVEWRADAMSDGYVVRIDTMPGRTRPEDNWVWSPQGLINMHYPEMWGLVQFSAAEVGDGGDAFVERPEDRARWFLRQVYYAQRRWHARHGRFTDDLRALGLETPVLEGFEGPIVLEATAHLFEASLRDRRGGALHIAQDGRVW
ncbi:MAG TPA: carbohydrate-binding family 9-like protein [Gemmatimonadales bacterium]|nr:carbohydrate-binding family 9-like protein [Gemmatimonadales bacterium]